MSNELWTDERLDRLASLAETNARLTQRNAEASERHDRAIDRIERLVESNARVIQALANASAEGREERDQLFRRIDEQQAEIRGMPLENRRILDILLNQSNQSDDTPE